MMLKSDCNKLNNQTRVKTAAAQLSICRVSALSTLPAQTPELGLLAAAHVCTAGLSRCRRRLARAGSLAGTRRTMTQPAWLVSPRTSCIEKPLPRGTSVTQGAALEEGLRGDTKSQTMEGRRESLEM